MNVGIVGSRRRNTKADKLAVEAALLDLCGEYDVDITDIVLVSGGCKKGADSFVKGIVEDYDMPEPIIHPAKWTDLDAPDAIIGINPWGKEYNRRAGYDRNTFIARDSEVLIACVASDRKGGTEDTVKKMEDKPVILC